MGAIGLGALIILMSAVSTHSPWTFAIAQRGAFDSWRSYLTSLLRCLVNREFLYVFGWLAPLGVWRVHRLPRPWVMASVIGVLPILVMGAYRDALGNAVRPIFNVAGPLLSLSAAVLLMELDIGGRRDAGDSPQDAQLTP